jgi:hypothetical protein
MWSVPIMAPQYQLQSKRNVPHEANKAAKRNMIA